MNCSTSGCTRKPEAGRSRCRSCRRYAKVGAPTLTPLRILFLDIETSPSLAYVWSLKQNGYLGLNQVEEVTEMLMFAARWLGEKKTTVYSQHKHGKAGMIEAAHRLLDEADVVVHWNGTSFDVPHIQRELLLAGLTPPSPFAQMDLLKTSRKKFRFLSQKLQHVSTQLGLVGKMETGGFELWKGVMADDPKAWKTMATYCANDVDLLVDLYYRLLPWIVSHPHTGLYGGSGCPTCGAAALEPNGFARTRVSKFRQFRCGACGSFFRSSKREHGVEVQAA